MHRARTPGLAAFAFLVAALSAASAAIAAERSPREPLLVFAASSLQGPLDTVADAWTARSGVRVVVSYAATPTLARQIVQGAPAHVVITADAHWMDWLADRDRIAPSTRFDLLGNSLVLVAPRVHPVAAWPSAEDALPRALGDGGRLAVADVTTVPAGRYAKQALHAIGRWDAVAGRLAMADNVRGALAFVARGEAPLGVVYATDARAESDVRVVAAFPDDTHDPIVYPAAVVAGGGADAAAFVAFLRGSADAARHFGAAGFRYLPRHDAGRAPRAPGRD